jgi:branched-chain amino acid transport system substrate-binding protein
VRSQPKTVRLGLSIAAALVLILVVIFGIRALTIKPVYIAVVTTKSDPAYLDDGTALLNGAQLYVDQINRQGGANGHTIKIKVYDDKGKVADAITVAQNIANDPDIVAVIGHLFSRTSLEAGDVYQFKGVPVITGTASATSLRDNKWYFSVVPGNDSSGAFLANYTNLVLKYKTVTVIYDSTDPYSSSLKDGFVLPFKGLGGKVQKIYDLDPENVDPTVNTIVDAVLSNPTGAGLIFIASQKNEAQNLIVALRRKGISNPILGGDALSGDSFAQRFINLPEEQALPGYFTNNIYASSPIIFDSANQTGQEFFNIYSAKYKQAPTWIAAGSYDATHVLVNAIEQTGIVNNNSTITEKRSQIRDYIVSLDSPDNAVKGGLSGDIYFDKKKMDAVKPVVVGVFSENKFISAPTQFLPIPNTDLVSNLDQDLAEKRILIMNGKYVRQTSIVYTGIDFNEISGLDESTSTYQMDFYIWFRYQGDVDATNIQFLNASGDLKLEDPLQSKDDAITNIHYRLYRVKGDFKSTFDFHNYPFDQQELGVRFRHATLTRDNLVYVVDKVSNLSVDKNILQSGGDWKIHITTDTPLFFPASVKTSSSLGDPQLIGLNPDTEYATMNVAIPISRDVFSFILRNLLPVFFTLLLTYMAYFLPAEEFGTRTGILTGSILTIAFFHLGVSSSLKVGYTVALDYAFYAFYAIIMIGLLTTMAEWYLHTRREKLEEQTEELQNKPRLNKATIKENEDLIQREKSSERYMLQTGRIFFPASLILLSLTYVLIYGLGVKLPALPNFGDNNLVSTAQSQTNATLAGETQQASTNGKVTLTIGSWRVTDQTQMNTILAVFNKAHPNIEVKFSPAVGDQYEKILRLQLQKGIAPDLFYLSSAGGRVANPLDIIANGDVEPLTGFSGLTNYGADAVNTWSLNNKPYALPMFAVSHGIYYNVDVFNKLHLSPPQTWDELITDAQLLQAANYIPIANAHYPNDKQRIGDLLFTNMAPTFIGGADGRLQYENGKRCFNDSHVVQLFGAIEDIAQYMPAAAETLSYTDSQQLFLQGKAAMYFGGSFEIPTFESNKPTFKWSVFAVPPPQGQPSYVNYHIDTAIALNVKAPHKAEALTFLKWVATPEFAKLLEDQLPGLFPLNQQAPNPSDQHGIDFLALNNGRGRDVRWVLPNTSLPDGRTLMQDATLGVMRGNLTPQQAADQLQNGLAQWYLPAQKCLP